MVRPPSGRRGARRTGLAGVLAGLIWFAGQTGADPSDLCIAAAREAASETGVPLAVLLAVSLTETGRTQNGESRPWPWTVNMQGEGRWFDQPDEALAFARSGLGRGARSFDVGCFQLNYRWHGENFESLDQMFDPRANALYAARFLARLRRESGTWSEAAGAYHSRTPVHATRYRATFDRHYAALQASGGPAAVIAAADPPARDPAPRRQNAFPLLRAGEAASLGSLVPLGAGG